MSDEEIKAIFGDYSDVKECTECGQWWSSACDGSKGSVRPCNSFLATRRKKIPEDIEHLKTMVIRLTGVVIFLTVAMVLVVVRIL